MKIFKKSQTFMIFKSYIHIHLQSQTYLTSILRHINLDSQTYLKCILTYIPRQLDISHPYPDIYTQTVRHLTSILRRIYLDSWTDHSSVIRHLYLESQTCFTSILRHIQYTFTVGQIIHSIVLRHILHSYLGILMRYV